MVGDWIKKYQEKQAFWLHDSNPRRPHALLTSGKHSGGYFNSKLVTEDATLLGEASRDLVDQLLQDSSFDINDIDRVVGPQTGATRLAESIATEVTIKRGRLCAWASPAKAGEGEHKTMVFTDTKVGLGEKVLLVEDVLNTGGSIRLTAQAVEVAGGSVLPYTAVLVNRSGFNEVDGRKIISLINHSMPIWVPEKCPLCKVGSEAIRPKGIESWQQLNASY
ncbi:MAG: phosphoribosyltransferase family protein [Patescibacteria group bacterium]